MNRMGTKSAKGRSVGAARGEPAAGFGALLTHMTGFAPKPDDRDGFGLPYLPLAVWPATTPGAPWRSYPSNGGASPQPHLGTGACSATSAPGWELCMARRVPHSR